MSSEAITHAPQKLSKRGLRLTGLIVAVVLIAIVVIGLITRASQASNIKTWTQEQAVPTVKLVTPMPGDKGPVLDLPGRLEAYVRAPIYAQVSGYLKDWKTDIGAPVKAGELLGEISTPEIDQQLLQARADLASAKANADLAGITAKRWQAMLGSDSVAQQDVDQRTGDYAAKVAQMKAAQANVDRLEATKAFARLIAPFDGVVTARDTDVGALVNTGGGAGQELFVVSDIHKLRVYVQVPQAYGPSIRPGSDAVLVVPEYPGREFHAQVVATSNAVNATSGTTLVQLMVDNADSKLMPGSFAHVHFSLPADTAALRVPASSLIFDNGGLRVATVDGDNKVAFKKVSILFDYGKSVEIGSGLEAGDHVIDSPPDGIKSGDQVKIATDNAAAKPHEKA
ncbi:efflux RND transporter periplasmic adaptor subunit [Dyella mobilis]|uniref:Efflux RND transporter periplasmic adaptor subunit n=1 Tax=Dyella mobilis TaxID=1849582 RepID=A0ABS2KFD4_9GAMM|nr:efflux RND transporter periplasmic adaptor subunit [Dyella mobilis]MBM7129870.1 efflux RND transporter periplasmic adaptor subunit [Dyella mobilis]GLQ97865.1 RND transporter MFP subunit [Dyella mobilis]